MDGQVIASESEGTGLAKSCLEELASAPAGLPALWGVASGLCGKKGLVKEYSLYQVRRQSSWGVLCFMAGWRRRSEA